MINKINLGDNAFGIVEKIEFKTLQPGAVEKSQLTPNIELVTYVINGKLTFSDNLGNRFIVGRGEVMHSSCVDSLEFELTNLESSEAVFIQYAILADDSELAPYSQAHKYKWKLRINQWLEVVSKLEGEAEIRISQDVKVDVIMLDAGLVEGYAIDSNRMGYLIQIEGSSQINDITLNEGDGLIIEGEDINLAAIENSHVIIIEMNKQALAS